MHNRTCMLEWFVSVICSTFPWMVCQCNMQYVCLNGLSV